MKTCEKCGSVNSDTAKHCVKCGNLLPQQSNNMQSNFQSNDGNMGIGAAAVTFFLIDLDDPSNHFDTPLRFLLTL